MKLKYLMLGNIKILLNLFWISVNEISIRIIFSSKGSDENDVFSMGALLIVPHCTRTLAHFIYFLKSFCLRYLKYLKSFVPEFFEPLFP